jgi:hypothetical protein
VFSYAASVLISVTVFSVLPLNCQFFKGFHSSLYSYYNKYTLFVLHAIIGSIIVFFSILDNRPIRITIIIFDEPFDAQQQQQQMFKVPVVGFNFVVSKF